MHIGSINMICRNYNLKPDLVVKNTQRVASTAISSIGQGTDIALYHNLHNWPCLLPINMTDLLMAHW